MNDGTRRNWTMLALITLTATLGLQTLRLFPTYIFFSARLLPFVSSSIDLGVIALVTMLVGALLTGVLWTAFKPRWALGISAGAVGLLRLAVQLSPQPSISLWFVLAGTAFFTAFVPIALGAVRGRGKAGGAQLALGLLMGLAIDSGLMGMWRTYDLAWHTDIFTLIVMAVLVAGQLVALARSLPTIDEEPGPEAGLSLSLSFVALGAFLILHGLQFQNIARLTTFSETAQSRWPQAVAFGLIVAANALAIGTSQRIAVQGRPVWARKWWWALLAAVLLIAAVSLTPPADPLGMTQGLALLNVVGLVVGNVLAAAMLTLAFMRLSEGDGGSGLWNTTVATLLGALLYTILLFIFYASYDIRMPFSNAILPPIAAALLALTTLLPARKLAPPDAATLREFNRLPAYGAMALIVLPVLLAILTPRPSYQQGDGGSLNIVNYNLQMGFDTDGRLGMEALAEVMLDADADIVVLQEVSRGWLMNSSMDTLSWLSYRLDMPYVFVPAADPVWGNAILSRYPIEEFELNALPRGTGSMRRSFFMVEIDYGGSDIVRIIGTHLHHVDTDTDVRIPQVDAIVAGWDGASRTLLMGDMNARAGEADLIRYTEAGLIDVYSAMGFADDEGLTFISNDLYQRIDWIFASPDVTYLDFTIPQTTASDHLPLVVTVELP